MIEAAPPGEPDGYDASKLVGYESIDILAKSRLLEIKMNAMLFSVPLYALANLFLLLSFITTGSLAAFASGCLFTIVYVYYCYYLRSLLERYDEVTEWCNFDIPGYNDDNHSDPDCTNSGVDGGRV